MSDSPSSKLPKKPAKKAGIQPVASPDEAGLDALMQALGASRQGHSQPEEALTPTASPSKPRVQDHPDWPAFKEQVFPARIHFYYPNPKGQEFYWDNVTVLKLDLERCQLIGEGLHGDPLRFDLAKMVTPRNAKTGQSVQALFSDLVRMWQETVGRQG